MNAKTIAAFCSAGVALINLVVIGNLLYARHDLKAAADRGAREAYELRILQAMPLDVESSREAVRDAVAEGFSGSNLGVSADARIVPRATGGTGAGSFVTVAVSGDYLLGKFVESSTIVVE